MRLREAQELLLGLVAAPEGVAKALEEREARGEAARAAVEELFAGDARMGAAERLDVYANMYFFRLRDVLAEDFARTSAALGEARWHNLVTDYLLAHPPTRWSLRWAGEALRDFLRAHPYGTERPWLADVAALEWARNEAFQAEDADPMRAADLLGVHPEVWPTLTFGATAGTAVVCSRWDLAAWWKASGEGAPAKAPEGQALLVWRDANDDVQHETLDAGDVEAVRRLLGGAPFADVCEALAPEEAGESEAGETGRRALELLLHLVERRGLVCTLHSAGARRV